MAPLAQLAHSRGYKVSGTDLRDTEVTLDLRQQGVDVALEYKSDALPKDCTVVISSAIPATHPELSAFTQKKYQIIHRSDLLNYFIERAPLSITVGGTHGKTTTSALILHMLNKLGMSPAAVVGGRLSANALTYPEGGEKTLVAEVDESDGTIIKYHADLPVLTNVDKDHLDQFHSIEQICEAFVKYLQNIKADGTSILSWDSKLMQEIGTRLEHDKITYGFRIGAEVRCFSHKFKQDHSYFQAIVGSKQISCEIPLIGHHNVMNAMGCLAVAKALEIDEQDAAASLRDFGGVGRRMSLIYKKPNLVVYDDYAHNPGKIAACLKSVRESFDGFTIYAIFEPHRYSRLKTMYDEFAAAFSNAHHVFVTPVYSAGEEEDARFNQDSIAKDIGTNSGVEAIGVTDHNSLNQLIAKRLNGPSLFITLGAGIVSTWAIKIREFLDESQQNF
jgi:UDP-N-acetylmuramate--alanine ligase